MIAALLLMAADVPRALLDRADAASGAYVGCLFGVTREAHSAGLPVDQFERRLASSCRAEEQAARQIDSRIFALRGDPNPAAKAAALAEETRRGMVANYRRLPDVERQLEQLAEICRQQPSACEQ